MMRRLTGTLAVSGLLLCAASAFAQAPAKARSSAPEIPFDSVANFFKMPAGMENGEIYKIRLNGQIVGKFGKAGKLPKEFGIVNAIDCRTENNLWVGEIWNWRVQKVTLQR